MVERILEALRSIDQYTEGYYNLKTGEIVFQNDFYPKKIEESAEDAFLRLPTQWEINEYSMMKQFALQQENKAKIFLTECLEKKGASRRFKDMVIRFGLQQTWYKYRDEQYLKIAQEWCENHNITSN